MQLSTISIGMQNILRVESFTLFYMQFMFCQDVILRVFYACCYMNCILFIDVHALKYTPYVQFIVFYAIYSKHCILFILFDALYSMHLLIVYYALYSLHIQVSLGNQFEWKFFRMKKKVENISFFYFFYFYHIKYII